MTESLPLPLKIDPRPALQSVPTLEGVILRRTALAEPAPGDWELGDRFMEAIIAGQGAEGSWSRDVAETGRRMLELLDLDVVANHPALELASEWALENLAPVFDRAVPFAPEQVDALLALIRLGRHYEGPVQRVVNQLAYDPERWLAEAEVADIAAALKLLAADPNERESPAIPQLLRRLAELLSSDEATDGDRLAALDALGCAEHGAARTIVESLVPFVSARQEEGGLWGRHTSAVVRALCVHGRWGEWST